MRSDDQNDSGNGPTSRDGSPRANGEELGSAPAIHPSGRGAAINIEDYRMPGGFDDFLETPAPDEREQNEREPDDEGRQWREARSRDEKVGYKRPPRSGQIRQGEVRNPFGRRGRRARRPNLAESGRLSLVLADRLRRKVQVKSGGKTRMVPAMEVLVDKLMRDALGDCPKTRAGFMRLIGDHHVLDAIEAFEEYLAEASERGTGGVLWTDEMERKFKIIEAEFTQVVGQDELCDWLDRTHPTVLAEYREGVERKEVTRQPAQPPHDGWGGY